MTELYNKINYKSPRDYVISEFIREYDISKANINILKAYNKISEEQYQYFLHCDRMERQIKIGIMIRDNPEIGNIIKNGIIEAKRLFFCENDIDDIDILQIRNDAVFLLNKMPRMTKFGSIEFKLKNVYTSFYKTSLLEFFYYQDQVREIENLNITGISDKSYINRVYPLHKEYFIEFLLTLFDTAQNRDIQEVINILTLFYNKYINRELDIGYYREFNSDSMYKLCNFSIVNNFQYLLDSVSKDQLRYVDIENNRLILSDLFKIFSLINTR